MKELKSSQQLMLFHHRITKNVELLQMKYFIIELLFSGY
jgi:hypothetical protein